MPKLSSLERVEVSAGKDKYLDFVKSRNTEGLF